MNFSKFRFYNQRGNTYLMESDIKRIIKNSKSIQFNKEKFNRYCSYVECGTIWCDRHLKEITNEKALIFARRVAKMYNLELLDVNDPSVNLMGTPYEKSTSKAKAGISYFLKSTDFFAVVSIPAHQITSSGYNMIKTLFDCSCDYYCLKCNKEIKTREEDWYDRKNGEYSIYELLDDRYECLCSDCVKYEDREVIYIRENKIVEFLRNMSK